LKNIWKFIFAISLPLAACMAHAQNADPHRSLKIQLDPAQTEIHWKVNGVPHTIHGVFKLKNGELLVNPESGLAQGEILLDATTEQGGTTRDRATVEQVLESNRYPGILFHPTQFKGKFPSKENSADTHLDGTLNVHGNDHPMQLALKIQVSGGAVTANGQFSIPYVDWGMKNPSTFFRRVGKQVDVQVTAKGSIQEVE
jgi:polyisoprenoid-binding protein YceI